MKKVLMLATYPMKNPQHGGQKRLHALYDAYRAVGFAVRSVGVFDKKVYRDFTKHDIALSPAASYKTEASPWTGDIISGQAIYEDPLVKKEMIRTLEEFRPDIIHLEQPFVYLGIKPLLQDLGLAPRIVYGSQNVEAPMKREILEGQFMSQPEVDKAVKVTEDAERQAVKDCDVLVACTDVDAVVYKKMGAPANKIVLARNGIDESHATLADIEHWKQTMKKAGIEQSYLFIASAHPPSITGFVDAIGKGLGFLKTNQKIMIAGSVSDYFRQVFSPDNLNPYDATFWLRAHACGRLSESRLGALLRVADVILLPITEGGGSNLKTAEALLADKKVITTSHALRSFEWAAELPNIWVADDRKSFQKAMIEAVDAPFVARTQKQAEKVKSVLWTNQLSEFKERIAEV